MLSKAIKEHSNWSISVDHCDGKLRPYTSIVISSSTVLLQTEVMGNTAAISNQDMISENDMKSGCFMQLVEGGEA
jgi:hypothetical protein